MLYNSAAQPTVHEFDHIRGAADDLFGPIFGALPVANDQLDTTHAFRIWSADGGRRADANFITPAPLTEGFRISFIARNRRHIDGRLARQHFRWQFPAPNGSNSNPGTHDWHGPRRLGGKADHRHQLSGRNACLRFYGPEPRLHRHPSQCQLRARYRDHHPQRRPQRHLHGRKPQPNRPERIVAHNNHDTGIHMAGTASHNLVLNCDSFHNFNTTGRVGNSANGFGAKFDELGPGNHFYGFRA